MIVLVHWLDAAGSWVWHTSLQASVLIVLVWLVQWALRKVLRPRWRYALGLLVLLRLVMPTVPPSSFSAFNLERLLPPTRPTRAQAQTAVPQIAFAALPATVSAPRTPTGSKPQLEWGTLFQMGAKVVWLLGIVGMLGIAGWRHRQLARSVALDAAVAGSRVLALLEEAEAMIGPMRSIAVVTTAAVTTPAVFGFHKPRLLLPRGLSDRLDDGELRLIFLHELTHVRRGDVLLNWIAICVRALHWFNPLVWLALRRLRADQELVCDASVLALLAPDERRRYGHTLVKLAGDFSETRLCPGLAPVITDKHEIKRRIIMIAQFKPVGRLAVLASMLLVVALCGLTFTRAAEPAEKKEAPASAPKAAIAPQAIKTERANNRDRAAAETRMRVLQDELKHVDSQREECERALNDLRSKLQMSDAMANAETLSQILTPDAVQRFEAMCDAAKAQLTRYETLLAKSKSMSPDQLRRSLPTAYLGRAELTELFTKRDDAEQELARLSKDYTPRHPDLQRVAGVLKKINQQIDDKIAGVIEGLGAVVEANRAQVETLSRQLDEAKRLDAELAAKYRPYYEVKRKYETVQKVYEYLTLQLTQEKVDLTMPLW